MKIGTVVKTKNGQYVLVDTCFTLNHGYETIVFPCLPNGKITDWGKLDMDLYPSAVAARFGHYVVCDKWSQMIFNKKED
jgi:hypothetical protein